MLNATVVKRVDINSSLILLRIKPDFAIPDFKPGQYIALGLHGSAERPSDFPLESIPVDEKKLIKRMLIFPKMNDTKVAT